MLTTVKCKKYEVLTFMDKSGTLNFKSCYHVQYLPTYGSVKVPSNVLFCDPVTSPASVLLYEMNGV